MRGWMGMGTILKLLAGIGVGMGIRVMGTVGDGYKYLSPCSSLYSTVHWLTLQTSLLFTGNHLRW